MATTLDELLASLQGIPPLIQPRPPAPVLPQSPYMAPQLGAEMGLPYPSSLMTEMPGSAPAAEEAPLTATEQYGYTPAPRTPLPGPIAGGAPELYGGFQQ